MANKCYRPNGDLVRGFLRLEGQGAKTFRLPCDLICFNYETQLVAGVGGSNAQDSDTVKVNLQRGGCDSFRWPWQEDCGWTLIVEWDLTQPHQITFIAQ